ncbi:hypothetical protein, partial [Nocardia abscessus]|uniref:hypothetical protein n=1 Tax=Nocardia abscessus TaxID=120957 RepID=UPI002456C390
HFAYHATIVNYLRGLAERYTGVWLFTVAYTASGSALRLDRAATCEHRRRRRVSRSSARALGGGVASE